MPYPEDIGGVLNDNQVSGTQITRVKNASVMLKLKSTIALILGALVILVAFQNMASVELTFLFWTFETRRIGLIAICVVTGFLLGRMTATHKQSPQADQEGGHSNHH